MPSAPPLGISSPTPSGAMFWLLGVVGSKDYVIGSADRSRHQQIISLSFMESDLFALQHVAQEMSSLGRIVARVLGVLW